MLQLQYSTCSRSDLSWGPGIRVQKLCSSPQPLMFGLLLLRACRLPGLALQSAAWLNWACLWAAVPGLQACCYLRCCSRMLMELVHVRQHAPALRTKSPGRCQVYLQEQQQLSARNSRAVPLTTTPHVLPLFTMAQPMCCDVVSSDNSL
jgi:hypothetical protein